MQSFACSKTSIIYDNENNSFAFLFQFEIRKSFSTQQQTNIQCKRLQPIPQVKPKVHEKSSFQNLYFCK